MPISEMIGDILHGQISAQQAMSQLLARTPKEESLGFC